MIMEGFEAAAYRIPEPDMPGKFHYFDVSEMDVALAAKLVANGSLEPVYTKAQVELMLKPKRNHDEYDVVMFHRGPAPVEVIRIVRQHTGMGLKEAKDLIDAAKPEIDQTSVIRYAMPKAEALAFMSLLRNAGANIDVSPSH